MHEYQHTLAMNVKNHFFNEILLKLTYQHKALYSLYNNNKLFEF
jgi:hypothetical protein